MAASIKAQVNGKEVPLEAAVEEFKKVLNNSSRVIVLSGAGISAESGIPTFRGAGGLWRKFDVTALATPTAFRENPALCWEFYHYRREIARSCKPNRGHYAVTALQQQLQKQGKQVTILTQNIDRLHQASGSKDVVELHGSLWLVKPVDHAGFLEEPGLVWEDRSSPICPALAGKGDPSMETGFKSDIDVKDLPHDDKGRLLRPGVVWFEEMLDPRITDRASSDMDSCDLFIVVGTSAVVYPAAGFASFVRRRGVPVVEVNLDVTPQTGESDFVFQGKAGDILPKLFSVEEDVAAAVAAAESSAAAASADAPAAAAAAADAKKGQASEDQ